MGSCLLSSWMRSVRGLGMVGLVFVTAMAGAQVKPAPGVPGAKKPSAPAAKEERRLATPAANSAPRSGKGWQVGPIPSWVVNPPAPDSSVALAPNAGARREQLVDFQSSHLGSKPQEFVRVRAVALDSTGLGSVSQPQITFNPLFQTVLIHSLVVVRDGQRSDRLAGARIEPMRREQRLEQQVIDGNDTLLVILNDVRVGEAVEVAYTVEGENPIFEGRISSWMRLVHETPVDLLHMRLLVPAGRTLQIKGLSTDALPERLAEGPHQVWRIVRHQVAAIAAEQNTPPWFKAYPAIEFSEYAQWAEVDTWAQRLFAQSKPLAPELVALAKSFRDKGLQGEALAAEVLRFVQDEVRYFSVSLGESSHRPKPPQQTLTERLGDCKDKVMLLNALLLELGFDAKPALVSVQRNRGIQNMLPSHHAFDHVITRLNLEGRTWYLDATMTNQGLALDNRGQLAYGAALVVGDGAALKVVPEGAAAANKLDFEQLWDLSKPGQPAQLEVVVRARGLLAEGWRASLGSGGAEAMTKMLAGAYARMFPGLKVKGDARVTDSRQSNQFEFRQAFEVPEFGRYQEGALEAEFLAVEILDVLTGPSETQRRTPFLVNQPRLVESRIQVTAPEPFRSAVPAPAEILDRQFRYSARLELQDQKATFTWRYERREDEVAAADLAPWRDKILQARKISSGRLRLPLLDGKSLVPELQSIDKRLRAARGWRADTLQEIVARNEMRRLVDSKVLAKVAPGSGLAAKVLASKAQASNLLGDFATARSDADLALASKPDDEEALDARAVALLGDGKAEQALAAFASINPQSRSAATASWMGSVHLYLGQAAQAEVLLREAVANGSGEGREFAMIWLFLAAERQGGRGKAAVAEYVDNTDAKKISGAILRYLTGAIDREALMRVATAQPQMERLNLAEANFYIGQRLLAQDQRAEAQRWFQRTLESQATPYRETTFARLELQRAAK
jgi:lipoprotein NlpI